MKYAELELAVVLSVAAVGCAGSLDENVDYFAKKAPVRAAGAGSGAAGTASGWRDAGAPVSDSAQPADSTEAQPDEDAGVSKWSAANGGAGGRAGWAGSSAAGKGGSSAAGSGGAVAAGSCDFRGLLMQKCAGASCHGAPAASTGLDLTSAMLAIRVQGRHGTGSCTDKLLVDPNAPEQSKLYLKVSGTSCGVKMPLGGSLTDSEQACVLAWIDGL